MDLNTTKIDSDKQVNGVWFNFGEGAKVKVARSGNPAYREALRKELEPYQEAIRLRILGNDDSEGILISVMAKTIFLDFEGLNIGGEQLTNSYETRLKILTEYESVREAIANMSDRTESFRTIQEEKDLGNLPTDLLGTSSSAES